MALTIRHPHVVLQRVLGGQVLQRERDPMSGHFVVRFRDGTRVADVAVRSLLDNGDLQVQRLSADGSVARYIPAGTTTPEEPAARARATDPATSHHAAASVQITASQRYVIGLLRAFGDMTTVELERVAATGGVAYSGARLRSACAELERLGILVRNGTRPTGHTTTTGVATQATVWSLQPSPP